MPEPPSRPHVTTKLPLEQHRLVRAGVFLWSIVGGVAVLLIVIYVLGIFRLVVIPLLIALFPASLLSPVSARLKRAGLPPFAASAIVLLPFLVGFVGLFGSLIWLVAGEFDDLRATLEAGYADVARTANDRFGWNLPSINVLLDEVQEWVSDLDVGSTASSVAFATLEMLSGVLLGLIALFFYLKDGERIAGVMLQLSPTGMRDDVAEVLRRVWETLGGYFRGQIAVAAIDAVFIGLGLVVLGVPLAVPLALLVFFGGLFPIVGAFAAGAVAVLIALAHDGLGLAVAVLVLNVLVQQIEGNLLEPLIVGRATQLHPLLVLTSLTAGAVTMGIFGAFIAVPVTASLVRGLTLVLQREPELAVEPGAEVPDLDDHVPQDAAAP